MPELPEVQTTVTSLKHKLKNKIIQDVWSDYGSKYYSNKKEIKNISYFKNFKKEITTEKIINIVRRGKNIIFNLSSHKKIVIHMKMTGHLLFGKYFKNKKTWTTNEPGPLQDSINQFIHFVLTFSDNTHLVLSDVRKFATIALYKNKKDFSEYFKNLGAEPLNKNFTWKFLKQCVSKFSKQKIKSILLNQKLIVGIGNIYSDEILWLSKINPERKIDTLTDFDYKTLTKNIKMTLSQGIYLKGDSTSDYRNPDGLPGNFHFQHNAYRRTNQKCKRKNCKGKIQKIICGGRSAHFCNNCQR